MRPIYLTQFLATLHVLVSCETIEQLPAPLVALREFRRVMRPRGLLYLTTPKYFNFMGLCEIYTKFRHTSRAANQPYDQVQLFFANAGPCGGSGMEETRFAFKRAKRMRVRANY